MWRSEDMWQESDHSCLVDPGNQTQVVGLGGKCFTY